MALLRVFAVPAIAVAPTFDGDPEHLTGANWMSGIADERLLSDMDIPGTHNAGFSRVYLDGQTTAHADAADYVVSQSKTIPQQLDDGVRLLDLDLTTRKPKTGWVSDTDHLWVAQSVKAYGGTITFYAQDANGNAISLKRVINYVRSFFKSHPTETVIVYLHGDGSGGQEVYDLMRTELGDVASYLYLGSSMPKLGDVRGKVVVCSDHPELLGPSGGMVLPELGSKKWVGGVVFQAIDATTVAGAQAVKSKGSIPESSAIHASSSQLVYSAAGYSSSQKPVDMAAQVNGVLYGSDGRFSPRFMLHGWSISDYLDASSQTANPRTLWLANFKESQYATVSFRSLLPAEREQQSARVIVGGATLVPGCTIEVPAKKFIGWNTESDGTGIMYQPGDRVEVKGDLTLWAQWKMTWASLDEYLDRLRAGADVTIVLEGDLTATPLDTCLHVPDKAKVTIRMNRFTLNRACETPKADGSVFKLGAGSTLILEGPATSKITGGNSNGLGGGVSMGLASTLVLDGVNVTGNVAAASGGGIAVAEDATLQVRSATSVAGNTAAGESNNVYLASDSAIIKVMGPLASSSRIGVNSNLQPKEPAIVVSSGLKGKGALANFTSDDPDYDVRLDAQGEAELTRGSVVHFESNGGSLVSDQSVPYGGKVQKPLDPSRSYVQRYDLDELQGKYEFMGWYKEPALKNEWDYNKDIVQNDLTLFAKWGVRVRFNLNGGTSDAIDDQVLSVGERVNKPADPTRDGYTFKCWTYNVLPSGTSQTAVPSTFDFDRPLDFSVVLTAQWVKGHTVVFDSDGGSAVQPLTNVAHGAKIVEPSPAPTKTGFNFDGWYVVAGTGSYKWDFANDVVVSDLTLHARWVPKEFVVTFYRNDGTGGTYATVANVRYGSQVDAPEGTPEYDGHVFVGWSTASDVYAPYDFSTPVTTNLNIHAWWKDKPVEPNKYVVAFNTNGGLPIPITQTVQENGNATRPATNPSKSGSEFAGWFMLDASGNYETTAYNFLTPITSDLVLHAKWKPTMYTVSFDSDGGSPVEDQSVPYGGFATEPQDPVRGSDLFMGWYLGDVVYDFHTSVTSDIKLKARWHEKSYPNTHFVAFIDLYDVNDPQLVDYQIVDDGGLVVLPVEPSREGLSFVGWFEPDEDGVTSDTPFDFAMPIVADHVLFAKWVEGTPTHVVTFQYRNGADDTAVHVFDGQVVNEPDDPVYEHHVFEGWYVLLPEGTITPEDVEQHAELADFVWFDGDDVLVAYDFAWGVYGNITLRARWSDATYTVSFDSAGGTPVDAQHIAYGQKAERPADPVREGYSFLGWSEAKDLVRQALAPTAADVAYYDFNSPVTSDLTLRAVWDEGNPLCEVRFDANGGSEVASQQVPYLGHASEPTTTREGYSFRGWYLPIDEDEVDLAVLEKLLEEYPELAEDIIIDKERGQALLLFDFDNPIFQSIELRAQWEPTVYAVRFHDGETTLDELEQSIPWGEKASRPEDPYRFGSRFVGWFVDAGLRQAYDFSTPVTAALDLYAGYSLNGYTVSFDSRGGTAVEAQQVMHGGKATRPADPTWDGHTFLGWYLLIAEGVQPEDFEDTPELLAKLVFEDGNAYLPFDFENVEILADTTLYARWQEGEAPVPTPSPTPTPAPTPTPSPTPSSTPKSTPVQAPSMANALPRTGERGLGVVPLGALALAGCVMVGIGVHSRSKGKR